MGRVNPAQAAAVGAALGTDSKHRNGTVPDPYPGASGMVEDSLSD